MSSIRSVLIFLTLFVLIKPALGQQDPKELARQYYEQVELILSETKAMEIALEQLVTAADLDTTFLKANYEAGHMHLITINKHLATKYFLRVLRQDPNYRFDLEYWIGRGYQYGFDFAKAIEYYTKYKEKLEKKSSYQGKDKIDLPTVDRSIFECESGLEFVSNPMNFSIVNIGREINSEFEDYAPVLNENEDEIVFTTRRRDGNMNENVFDDNKPWEDIFIARKNGSSWEAAKNIGAPVNTPFHNSNSALSADGKTLFVFTDEGNGDLYFTRLTNGNWSEPEPLPGIINSTFEEKSITLSKDETTLYFSSNRPGGYGGLDLYKAAKDEKGNWSNVRNLGPKINSDHDEDGPFIDYDGTTLYYSSKGRKGMGGFDVFKVTYDDYTKEWSEPLNLGYPINTPDDDIYFVTSKDSKRAYYSSVREDGMGYTDIYMITIPEGLKNIQPTEVVKAPVDTTATVAENTNVQPDGQKEPVITKPEPKKEIIPLKYIVSIVDADDKSPIDAKVRLAGAKDNVVVGMTPSGGGTFEFNVNSKTAKDYKLSIEKEGYAFQNLTVKIGAASTEEKTVTRTVELRKLAVNVTGVMRNIYFDFDKATFKTESYGELNKLEAMLRQNSNVKVEIGGHTDNIGTWDYNIFLSRKRAEAVKDYLTKKGIDARRIKAVGYGKKKPLVSNDDEEDGREINRRVEFKVLSN